MLTLQLLDVMKQSQPARIVCLASSAHQMGSLDFEDLEYKKRGYTVGADAYGASKLANMLFAKVLNEKLKAAGLNIKAFSVHPGVIAVRFV